MTRRARKGTPAPETQLTVPGLRVLVAGGDPDAPPETQKATAAPPGATHEFPAVRRKRRVRFVF